MTNKTIEEIAREIIYRMVPKELAYKYYFAFDAVEAMLVQALREQAAQTTLPSFESFRESEQLMRRKTGKDAPMDAYWAYDWIKANTKPKERHEVSDAEQNNKLDDY